MSSETLRSSCVQMVRSSPTCLALSRRPSRLDMYILSPSAHLPVGNTSQINFSDTSRNLHDRTAAGTSKRSPRRQISIPSHFIRASACSSWVNSTAMEFRSFRIMPAAVRLAWSSGNPSDPTSTRAGESCPSWHQGTQY